MKTKFEKIYDVDGYVDGYKAGNYYIMKHYYWNNQYTWIINNDGKQYYSDCEFQELKRSGEVITCISLKDAKEKVNQLIEKESMVKEMIESTECKWNDVQKEMYLKACMERDESIIRRYYEVFKNEEELKKTSYFIACLLNE